MSRRCAARSTAESLPRFGELVSVLRERDRMIARHGCRSRHPNPAGQKQTHGEGEKQALVRRPRPEHPEQLMEVHTNRQDELRAMEETGGKQIVYFAGSSRKKSMPAAC